MSLLGHYFLFPTTFVRVGDELRRTPLRRSSQNPLTGNSVNKGSLLQVVAERELRLRVRLLIHLEGERAGVFWYLFPLVGVAASPVGLHPHPVHPIEARRGYSGYRECYPREVGLPLNTLRRPAGSQFALLMLHVAEHHARFAHVHARKLDDLQIQPALVPRQEPQVAVIDHRLLPRRLETNPTLPRSKALLPQPMLVPSGPAKLLRGSPRGSEQRSMQHPAYELRRIKASQG